MRIAMKHAAGFTLIEWVIAIAIVAILVALAIPVYTDHTIRSKVAECIDSATVPKLAGSKSVQTSGITSPDTAKAEFSDENELARISEYCAGYRYADGRGPFAVTADTAAIGAPLIGTIQVIFWPFSVSADGMTTNWACFASPRMESANLKYLPAQCRQQMFGPPVDPSVFRAVAP